MSNEKLNKGNNNRSDHKKRSGRDGRSEFIARSDEKMFLRGNGRFSRHLECAFSNLSKSGSVVTGRKNQKKSTDKRLSGDRRTGHDRRSGVDTRSEVEQFLQGERRSNYGRRSGTERRHRSFKKARVFVRDLGLKSIREWCDYVRSGKKPDDIPHMPHKFYANDGWAGWRDWLGVNAVAARPSQYRSFKKASAFVRSLGLVSISKWRAYSKSAKKPDDIPPDPETTYAEHGWAGWGEWLGHASKYQT
jgi:hypothetical protein